VTATSKDGTSPHQGEGYTMDFSIAVDGNPVVHAPELAWSDKPKRTRTRRGMTTEQ
jgi:hypothetical protein